MLERGRVHRPFVVSLSNHERHARASTSSGRAGESGPPSRRCRTTALSGGARPAFALAVVLAALVAILRGQAPRPNVLLVTIDTVRADRIGAYGYAKAATPAIDRLAREGVRFADATSQAPLTGPAHAALLTGLYPARLGVRDNATTPVPDTATTAAKLF